MQRLLLKPTEAAEVLGIGRTKIYSLLSSGELPAVRVGRSIRVPAAALQEWLDRQMVPTARPSEGGEKSPALVGS